ncbi:MAG: gamma carbonic anhydrase family protein [Pyrinomonadaceae bacterium]
MKIKHNAKIPVIEDSAYVAPNAVVCGDVKIGKNCKIMFGAAIIAEGGKIEIGDNVVIFENAVVRSTPKHSAKIGSNVLIGPHAHVVGCTIEDSVFVATGASIFHGAHLCSGSQIRVNGVVHISSKLLEDATVPIGWVAVGNPARVFSPDDHDSIWKIQKRLNFSETVYGLDQATKRSERMPMVIKTVGDYLGSHFDDEIVDG